MNQILKRLTITTIIIESEPCRALGGQAIASFQSCISLSSRPTPAPAPAPSPQPPAEVHSADPRSGVAVDVGEP